LSTGVRDAAGESAIERVPEVADRVSDSAHSCGVADVLQTVGDLVRLAWDLGERGCDLPNVVRGVVFGSLDCKADTVVGAGEDRVEGSTFTCKLAAVRWWRRWTARPSWSSRTSRAALDGSDQIRSVVFGSLNSVANAVVGTGKDGVESSTLACELGKGSSKNRGGEEEDCGRDD
jgi:hypothetical protein